ncbi:MAG TPA: hypothetical protein ENJ17_01565 [Gammaproteobacteria bacterium]|nr:hypothetical protein [Gammaproteobacteria bacterium]
MNRTLVTLLGRVPRDENGYRTTGYRYLDGEAGAPAAFPGWELARRPRPVLYLFEAVITHLCQMARVEVQDFEGREWARSNYEERLRAFHDERNRYRLLKSHVIRSCMAPARPGVKYSKRCSTGTARAKHWRHCGRP